MRRPLAVPTLAVAALALAVVGCQGQPVALLDDPDEILAAAATTTAAATSVRVDLGVEGTIAFDPMGTGVGAPVDLRDTKVTADLDLTTGNGRVAFSSPGLLGITGEAIITTDAMYVMTSMTGPKYQVSPIDDAATRENPLKGLTDFLARADLDPMKGDDVPCAGGTCYTLTVQLTAAQLAALAGGALPSDLGLPVPDVANATVDLVIHIEQSTRRVSDIAAKAALGDVGDLTVQGTFTHWNESFQIRVPSPEMVEGTG
jgi:hypothetical protein